MRGMSWLDGEILLLKKCPAMHSWSVGQLSTFKDKERWTCELNNGLRIRQKQHKFLNGQCKRQQHKY